MSLDRDELAEISTRTLAHYERGAEGFWQGTQHHDVSQNIEALLSRLEGAGPHVILDLGCGPGRDLVRFIALGHVAVGLDGCARFCEMARAHAGAEVLQQDFVRLALPSARFDGIFANASLFHVPSRALPRVLGELRASLRPGGVLFASNPRGHNEEGWSGGRYSCFYDLETWRAHVTGAGFVELAHYFRPEGKPLAEQPWLATVWRRPREPVVD